MSINVVIVDDNEAYRDLIAQAVATMGWKCRTAATVEDGFYLVSEIRPKLLVTDIHLPDSTGFELCRRIKESPELQKSTRVLMMTGTYKREEAELRAQALGADAYLPKPFRIPKLLEIVKQLVEGS